MKQKAIKASTGGSHGRELNIGVRSVTEKQLTEFIFSVGGPQPEDEHPFAEQDGDGGSCAAICALGQGILTHGARGTYKASNQGHPRHLERGMLDIG